METKPGAKKLVISRFVLYVGTSVIATFLLGLTLFLLYPYTLSLEEKVNRGYLELAKEDALSNLNQPNLTKNLALLAKTYALSGNVGRARLIERIYSLEEPTVEAITRVQLSALKQAKEEGTIRNPFHDQDLRSLQGYPIYGDLKFFVGYQLALLGDWHGAESYFNEANRNGTSQHLKPYLSYYIARAKINNSENEARSQAKRILKGLLRSSDKGLVGRSALNLAEMSLEDGRISEAMKYLRIISPTRKSSYDYPSWIVAKANILLGDFQLKRGELAQAINQYISALSTRAIETRRSALNGALNALGEVKTSASLTKAELALSQIRELAEAAVKLKQTQPAKAIFERILCLQTLEPKLRLLFLSGLMRLISQEGDGGKLEILVRDAEKIASSLTGKGYGQELAYIYLNYADFLEREKNYETAKAYLKKTIAIGGTAQGEAEVRLFRILRKQSPVTTEEEQIALLSSIVMKGSDNVVKAGEELIPLLLLKGRVHQASELLARIRVVEPALADFWLDWLESRRKPDKEKLESNSSFQIRNFSYYELARINKLSWDNLEWAITGTDFLKTPEVTEEYLLSQFLTSQALELAGLRKLQGEGPTLWQAIYANNLELTTSINVSSTIIESMLEDGRIGRVGKEPLLQIITTAYPMPYRKIVQNAAKAYGLDEALVYAVMKKESNFKVDAVSPAGAVGLMQILPSTADYYLKELPSKLQVRSLKDPEKNIFLGCAYLARQLRDFGSEAQAIAAYNAGPGNLRKWLSQLQTGSPELFIELMPEMETEYFVKKVLKYKKIYQFIRNEGF